VLRDVDLAVRSGVLTVVRGRSGSGKSTALRLLLGLERPDEGTAELGGIDLAALDRAGLADHRRTFAAYAGQEPQLVETLDVTANLDLARAMRDLPNDAGMVRRALEATDLAHLARRTAGRLSGGERQRVAVARALAVEARLVVCAEPTSQLDEATAGHVAQALLATARGGAAGLVATHDPVLLDLADVVHDLSG
jgi:ABC-type lipoprotein export system ATPase subunit